MQGLVSRVVGKPAEEEIMLPILENDEDGPDGPPSTASSMSLTRLRFTVTSIIALREAARFKRRFFESYISRSAFTYTGHMAIGEGLDGCARETLDFLASYDPDCTLLLDSSILFEGLQHGGWINRPFSDVMTSVLATGMFLESGTMEAKPGASFAKEVTTVEGAICVAPESKDIMLRHLLRGWAPKKLYETRSLAFMDLPPITIWLVQISAFLYAVRLMS